MKVMLLAAGKGERMRPLTLERPKPLLEVGGTPLIAHHLRHLSEAGLCEVVINVSWLGAQIMDYCGDGSRWGVSISYSEESEPLETAGGIVKALPLLGTDPFLVVNADVLTDYPFKQLAKTEPTAGRAHLVFVDNPEHHPEGDYSLSNGSVGLRGKDSLTYSGLASFDPQFFAGHSSEKKALRPLLDQAISEGRLSGEHYEGFWADVGTPQRLQQLNLDYVGR